MRFVRRTLLYKVVTFVGVAVILLLQSLWAYNTYQLLEHELCETANKAFVTAINNEVYSRWSSYYNRFKMILWNVPPPDTHYYCGPGYKNQFDERGVVLPLSELFYSPEFKVPLNVQVLDSLYGSILKSKGISCPYKIIISNQKTHRTTFIVRPSLTSRFMTSTGVYLLRTDKSVVVQAVIMEPYRYIFPKMGSLFGGTILMLLFIVGCIVYQIRIISRQRKVAQLRQDFSNAMIHDMKTPLSSILIGTRILHSGKLDDKPEKRERHFDIIEEEAQRLLALINRILTLSKLENKRLELQKQFVVLAPMLEKMTEHFRIKADKPVVFRLDLKTDIVYADEEYLREILENIIDNAIKYSKPVGVRIYVTSDEDERQHITTISIRDDGMGISESDIKKIFRKFERASAVKRARKGGASGFGLGLNYVYQVMKAHGGRVDVKSAKGQYSEFVLTFPRQEMINMTTE